MLGELWVSQTMGGLDITMKWITHTRTDCACAKGFSSPLVLISIFYGIAIAYP
jgi:hypothetical protein